MAGTIGRDVRGFHGDYTGLHLHGSPPNDSAKIFGNRHPTSRFRTVSQGYRVIA